MNLVKELTPGYFFERFRGCMFKDAEGRPNYIDTQQPVERDAVICNLVGGTPTKPTLEKTRFPWDFFADLSVFSVPALGWRQAGQGRYLVHFRRNNRTYHRAVAANILQRWVSPATKFLLSSGNLNIDYYDRMPIVVHLVMLPEYTPLKDGIAAMRKGEIFSFCTSPNLAVIPDVDEQQAIYFNTSRVGTVLKDGTVTCTVPFIDAIIREAL